MGKHIPETAAKRLDPLNDFAFQKTMGEVGDEPQLLSFLQAVLERTGKGALSAVTIQENKDVPPDIAGGKMSKLDVLAELPDGTKVNVEVQIKNQYNMDKRSLYYWALKFTRDFTSGSDYADLLPVITINIINFEFFENIDDFHTSFHLYEDRHKDAALTDVCEIHFLEMTKFRRLARNNGLDRSDPLHRWLIYFDKNSPREAVEEVLDMDNAIRMAQSKMDMIARDPAMLRAYEQYEKAASDYVSGINGARRAGRLEGKREGKLEGRLEIAGNMKKMGFSPQQIADATGLQAAEIAAL
jgi:predicted transposase/invertase (TIGR01784 family)